MDMDVVNPELRAATARVPAIRVESRLVRTLLRWAGPMVLRTKAVPGVAVRTLHEGRLRARIYTPEVRRTDAALLWIHGGGLVIGSASQDDRFCSSTAAELGMVVVSAEYRLAPEHPFPAGLDDITGVWEWMLREAPALGIRPDRIAVGGQSAGGGLAACLVQRLRDTSPVQPLAQWLFCPMLDDRTADDRALDAVGHFVWNNTANRFGWDAYLGADRSSAAIPPYAVAARAEDLDALPPAWISVGDIELFFAEDRLYADRLAAAGVEVTFDVTPGAPHGFESWASDTALAQDLLRRAREWLQPYVG